MRWVSTSVLTFLLLGVGVWAQQFQQEQQNSGNLQNQNQQQFQYQQFQQQQPQNYPQHQQNGGRKWRVPGGYQVQLGTWPLVEITKMQKRVPKLGGALGSFMKSALSPNKNKPHSGYKGRKPKFGGKPISPMKPVFFADVKNTLPLPRRPLPLLTDIGGGGGGSPPPAPIGIPYPSQAQAHPTLLNSGLLPVKVVQFYAPQPTTTTEAPLPLPPPATSVLGRAAYSAFFGNGGQVLRSPNSQFNQNSGFNSHQSGNGNWAPGPVPYPTNNFYQAVRPPTSYRPISSSSFWRPPTFSNYAASPSTFNPQYRPPFYPQFQQQQSQAPVMTLTDPVPAPSERYQQMALVPAIPPVIRIGSHPPPGYVMTHGEQQLITLKLPDVKMGKKMDTADLLRGAEIQHGPGHGVGGGLASLRRADIFKSRGDAGAGVTYTEEKKLPDVGAMYTVNMVLQTPNISAPVNGSESPHFHKGMEEMGRLYGGYGGQFGTKSASSPLDVQVKLLGKLFTDLQRLKPGKSRVPDEGQGVGPLPSYTVTTTSTGPSSDPFSPGSQTSSQKTYYKPKVDAPLLAVHIQSYSLPEPGSSDPDVLDSARIFGLQGHKFEFGSTNEIINLMDTAQRSVGNRVPIEELGYSRGEVNHNLQEWIRSYVTLTRKMKDEAHSKGEGIANQAFKQHQYQMRMPDNTMQAMDPKMFSQGASITNAGAVATYQG